MGLREASGRTTHVVIDKRQIAAAMRNRTGDRAILADTLCTGLRLRINARSAVWSYSYRPRGVDGEGKRWPMRTLQIGDAASLTPSAARAAAEAIKAQVSAGGDPRAERKEAERVERLAQARRKSLGESADDYFDLHLSGGTRHHQSERRNVLGALADLGMSDAQPDELRVPDVRRLLAAHSGAPATAKHRFGALSRFLDYLVETECLEVNCVKMVARRSKPKPPSPRSRMPSARALRAIWEGAGTLTPVRRDYLRVMVLAPLRASELAEIRPSNLDHDARAVVLAHRETKNHDPFEMPLSSAAYGIIAKRISEMSPRDRRNDCRVFQLSSAPGRPYMSWSDFLADIHEAAGLPARSFGFHDLRRLFLSESAEHEIGDSDVVDALLNHRVSTTVQGARRAYMHARLAGPKRRVMDAWGALVSFAVEHGKWPRELPDGDGATVVPLKRAR